MKHPTALDVLVVMRRSPPSLQHSIYIASELRRNGIPVTAATCLRRLRELESLGYVERSAYPFGYYGFKWTVTPAGLERLEGAR